MLKPGTISLLEAIESFLQLTDIIRKVKINIFRMLFHINALSESIVEKCILNVKLSKMPFIGHNKRKHNMDNGTLDSMTKSVSVVEIRYLCIAFGNKTSFETLDGSIK